ncbi:acyltransferase family protein [Klebsiella sp. 1SOBk5mer]|uniref:Putative acetylase n=1 Tax=Klebsiella pneumoniae TaxID=573 RepID=X2H4J9_KLEPN|nr:putative acetylase [Klebsiella pneumoniae]HBQ8785572.1 acyltransferase [Klebsiella quasipneumoniae]
MSIERKSSFELLRLLSIFGVVLLHISYNNSGAMNSADWMRLFFRWCVPFFFMLSGYFLTNVGNYPDVKISKIRNLAIIIFFSNLLYLPFVFYLKSFSFLSAQLFYIGTWFHLWFLNSLLLSYFFFIVFADAKFRFLYISILSITIFSLFYFIDLMSSIYTSKYYSYLGVIRQFQSIPFVWVGFILSSNRFSIFNKTSKSGMAFIALGLFLCFLELLICITFDLPLKNRTLLIGFPLICIGLILVGETLSCRNSLGNFILRVSQYTLIIYIVHPLIIPLISKVLTLLHLQEVYRLIMGTIFTFIISLLIAFLMKKYFPRYYSLLKGKFQNSST